MITAITAKNQADYLKLFREASDALVAAGKLAPAYGLVDKETFDPDTYVPGVYYTKTVVDGKDVYTLAEGRFDPAVQYYFLASSITTLEEYFCNLKNIYELPTGRKDKFLMLPVDEEMFEINADTRVITVPPTYRKAGIGVQGDTIAETLLFKVNRFFDTMDFNNCEIFIQWEGPAAPGQAPVQYVYPVDLVDIETYAEEGKMVFGWRLTDNITATSGNIKFSVRFIKLNESDKVVYSFSTLTAQAVINPGLDFDLNAARQDDMASDLFSQVVENSEASIGVPAATPIYVNEEPATLFLAELAGDANVGKYEGGIEYSVAVEDFGDITYKWYHKASVDSARRFLGVEGQASVAPAHYTIMKDMRKTTDTSFKANKNYWVQNDQAPTGYSYYIDGAEKAVMANLYERYSVLTIKGTLDDIAEDGASPVTGIYYVEAVNRKGLREKTARSTPAVTCPAPTAPVITQDLPVSGVMTVAPNAPEGTAPSAALEVKFTVDTHAKSNVVWKYSADKNTWSTVSGSTGASVTVDDVGYYQAYVNGILNLGRATTASKIMKVTNLPAKPVFAAGYADNDANRVVSITNDKAVTISRKAGDIGDGELYSESVVYRWYGNIDNGQEITDEDKYVLYMETTEPTIPLTTDYNGPRQLICKAVNTLSNKSAISDKSCLFVIIN